VIVADLVPSPDGTVETDSIISHRSDEHSAFQCQQLLNIYLMQPQFSLRVSLTLLVHLTDPLKRFLVTVKIPKHQHIHTSQ